jgi:lipid-binding SYLF domain-containing protein
MFYKGDHMLRTSSSRCVVLALAALFVGACESEPAPKTASEAEILSDQVAASIKNFKTTDPTLDRFFKDSQGYAVFPAVRSAAVAIGGAYGQGEVYEKGKLIGHADLSQANIGASLGGQRYAEIIFFKDEGTLATFKTTQVQFDARASAIAASAGAGTSADYQKGVAIFTLPEGGLMFQAAVGGQKFHFAPLTN